MLKRILRKKARVTQEPMCGYVSFRVEGKMLGVKQEFVEIGRSREAANAFCVQHNLTPVHDWADATPMARFTCPYCHTMRYREFSDGHFECGCGANW